MKKGILLCFAFILILPQVGEAFEVEVGHGLATCKGHEFLSTRAAKQAGIPSKYWDSISLGARYVDLGGLSFVQLSELNRKIHENESSQHHHFCYRKTETHKGSVTSQDLRTLTMDTTAWINKIAQDARAVDPGKKQVIPNGGVTVYPREVYVKYFLLGAALHAIQDSFAHGHRVPTIPNPNQGSWASTILRDVYGGPEGRKVFDKYRTITTAVDYVSHVHGSAKHNEVYTKSEGSPFHSDKVWNSSECTTVRDRLGNLVPHAFAAYLASLDFLRTFERRQPLKGFFDRWFQIEGIGNPGLGNPEGKCSSGSCPHLDIPGESH